MSDLLLQAMSANQSGDIALAKQLLSQALIQDPNNEAAWMLMSDVVEEVKLRRNCLERVLAINPNNTAASKALTKLNTSPLSPVTRGERDKPLNPPKLEKIPPFTPPFTWEGDQKQYLALGDLTYPDLAGEQPEQSPETVPTFDWANESDEPDKTIQKIFNAISNPELASQPLPDTDLNWLDESNADVQTDTTQGEEEDMEARYLDLLVGPEEETLPEPHLASLEDYSVSAEPQLGLDAFALPEQPMETVSSDLMLWDNPKVKVDRLVILSSRSLVYANPQSSDIPHIQGLFAEKKMVRDLLGENAGMIKLESVKRLTTNPKTSKISIDYLQKDKLTTHQLIFASPQVRDEVLTALQMRLESNFSLTTRSFSLLDKIVPPIVILLFVAFIGWGLVAGLPMLNGLPPSQLGSLQVIVSGLQRFVSSIGIINLIVFLGLCALLTLIWMMSNLTKPSKLVIMEQH